MENNNDLILTTEQQQIISADLAHNYAIIPKESTETTVVFYIEASRISDEINEELSMILGKSIVFKPINATAIAKALVSYYRKATLGTNASQHTSENFEVTTRDFLEALIFEAKSIGSSDIHFEVYKDDARIRYRIDGKLIEKYKVKKEEYLELVNKIKIKSNLDITEKRLPQDGRIHYDNFDIRVSILPTLHGEKIVMRILGKDTGHLNIDKLGMEDEEKYAYLEALKATKGIILISGPTGSGKTTTLYASLKLLNKVSNNIVTIEDPIEYTLEGINQVQLRSDIGLTFTSALKTFLRQDPDIIMLGEIRDGATAEMAIRASLTGHLVLSTIHTNSALGTISRLIDMGVPAFLIAETLKISVAQRLVRQLCNTCKKETTIVEGEYNAIITRHITKHWEAKGCESCHYTGYKGRTAIYEMIPMTTELKQEIKKNATNLEEAMADLGKSGLATQALELVKNGITAIEEVYSIITEG